MKSFGFIISVLVIAAVIRVQAQSELYVPTS